MRGASFLVLLLLLLLPARSSAADSSSVFDGLSTAQRAGAWTATVQGGWPWLGLRAQIGMGRRLALVGEVETAIFRRWHPGGGLSWSLVETDKGRLAAEAIIGAQIQLGELAEQGPSLALRLRLAARPGPVGPYIVVATRHGLLFHRQRSYRLDEEAPDVEVDVEHRWSPSIVLGLAFAPSTNFGFDIGMDFYFVDVGIVAVSLPGFHVALHFGNSARGETP